jgi:hypothetical protein
MSDPVSEVVNDDDDEAVETITHDHCDQNALYAEYANASDLTRNVFHKICPGQRRYSNGTGEYYSRLGRPMCGDGTAYSFLYARPAYEASKRGGATMGGGGGGERILIELGGGGACWDSATCIVQSFMLTFPTFIVDGLVGTSCTGGENSYGKFLCDRNVGHIDFSTYEYVYVPYCTQDVHMGDAIGVSNNNATTSATAADDASATTTSYGVMHAGAHNLYRTLTWIMNNFPNPSEVVLTGCSAGATPLSVAYEIVNSHYSKMGKYDVRIDVVADSPVFLTPMHYVRNYLPNWNVGTILDVINFEYATYADTEKFSDAILDRVLRGSKVSDDFVYVTHDEDDVSLFYYSIMNGTVGDASAAQDPTMASAEWWAKMNVSLEEAMDGHTNFHAYVMEGNGHCTFGLVRHGIYFWFISTMSIVCFFAPPLIFVLL